MSQDAGKPSTFIFIYVCLFALWLFGGFMTREFPVQKIETLNYFECPDTPKNKYHCQRLNLRESGEYPFFYEQNVIIFDVKMSLRLYRQTGSNYNKDVTLKLPVTFSELLLDSDGKESVKESKVIDLTFDCIGNERICGDNATLLVQESLPPGKHYFLLTFPDHEALFKEIKHAEVFMQRFGSEYQNGIIYLKLSMLVLLIISTALYYKNLKRVEYSSRSVQQKWILFLSGGLVCLNDPLSLLHYQFGAGFLTLLSKTLLAFGLSAVLPFCISTLRNIKAKEQSELIILEEAIFAIINLAFTFICTFLSSDHTSLLFSIWKTVNYAGGCMLVKRAFQNLLSIHKLTWIDRLFMLLTLYFATTYFGIIYRWETPIGLSGRNYANILSLICPLTVYAVICQYIYAFRKESISESTLGEPISQRKDYDELSEDIEKTDFR